jgi:sulfide:quinone oxidoreductase
MDLRKLDDDITVAPQITREELAQAAGMGFKTIICNRPDGEELNQPVAEDMADAAGDAGMTFVHQPVISGNVTMSDVEQFGQLLKEMPKPILAYCRSGTRCSTLWALAEAPNRSVDEIIQACANAGYDYSGLRPTLETLAKS